MATRSLRRLPDYLFWDETVFKNRSNSRSPRYEEARPKLKVSYAWTNFTSVQCTSSSENAVFTFGKIIFPEIPCSFSSPNSEITMTFVFRHFIQAFQPLNDVDPRIAFFSQCNLKRNLLCKSLTKPTKRDKYEYDVFQSVVFKSIFPTDPFSL